MGLAMRLRVRGVDGIFVPMSIEELPLPCDAGRRAVLSFRTIDGSVLTGVRLDECEIPARVYPDSITREQVRAAIRDQRLTGVSIAPLLITFRDYLVRVWGLVDDDGRPFAIPRRPIGSVGIRFETRGRRWFEERSPVVFKEN